MENNYDPYKAEKQAIKFGIIAIIVFTLIFLVFSMAYTIKAGERGVLLTFQKPSMDAVGEGLHFKIPLMQKIVKLDVKTQKYVADASAASKDLQIVSTEIAVNYHLVPETVPKLYQEIGLGFENSIIQPAVQEVIKASTAKFTAEELITRRSEVKEDIKMLLRERLVIRGIITEEISITDFEFSESFNDAIEAKVKAEQLKLKAVMDLERAELEALAIKYQREQLSPDFIAFIQLEIDRAAIDKWDGVLPKFTGSSTPLISLPDSL